MHRIGNAHNAVTFMCLMLISIYPITCAQPIARQEPITRLNYGVILKPLHKIRIVTNEWIHVFVLELPKNNERNDHDNAKMNRPEAICQRNFSGPFADYCDSFKPLLLSLHKLQEVAHQRLQDTIGHMYDILPTNYESRHSRGLFDLGGQILSSLFGVATNGQLAAIKETSRKAAIDNAKVADTWQKQTEQMASFMSVANSRLNNIVDTAREQNIMIKRIYTESLREANELSIMKSLVASAITNTTDFITMLNELDDIRIAIEGLAHGFLSPVLIPHAVIGQVIRDISSELANFHGIKLVETNPTAYYGLHDFVAARQSNNLLIAIRFPISSVPTPLTLYQFQTFPLPVPGENNTNHVTQLTNLPFGIAFHSTNIPSYYLIFHSKPELTNSGLLHWDHTSEPLRTFGHPTCASALVSDDRHYINRYCHYSLTPDALAPNIISITPSQILVTNVTSLIYECPSGSAHVHGCLQCQMTVPCNCSLRTPVTIPARLDNCVATHHQVTRLHTVNLAVLQKFFTKVELGALSGKNLPHYPLPVSMPEFKIFSHNQSNRLANDKKLSYDLNRVADITRKEGKVFHNLAETLVHDSYQIESENMLDALTDWSKWAFWYLIGTTLIAAMALVGVSFLYYRLKILSAAFLVLQTTLHKTAAYPLTIPSALAFVTAPTIYQVSETPQTPAHESISRDISSVIMDHLTPVLCFIIIGLLLCKKYRLCKSNPNTCNIILEFGNHTNTLQIVGQSLPGSPTQYTFSAKNFIEEIRVSGRFRPKLHVDWPTLVIHNHHLNITFDFIGNINTSYFQASQLRKIINGKYWCILLARYEYCTQRVELIRKGDDTYAPPETQTVPLEVTTTDKNHVQSYLYPTLSNLQANIM